MKTTLTFLAFLAFGVCSAQQTSNHKNPPSMADQELTIRQMAEIQAFEIQKACGIDDKADMSKVLKACYEFELDASMEANRGNDEAMAKMTKRMDEAIRSVVGNQKMVAYEEWKLKPKPHTSNY